MPNWYTALRDAVYGQDLKAGEIVPLCRTAEDQAEVELAGAARYIMLSRCDYLMGKVYQDEKMDTEAIACFERGIARAEQANAVQPLAEAYELIAAHVGQLCMIRSTAWVMSNGLKVEQNARKALGLNPRNAGAQYLLASRWAFGPGIFGNPKRGVVELEAMLNGSMDLQQDDLFNVYSALGYAYIRLKKNQDALIWVKKSLALYPTNKFALDLLSQIPGA